jgi:hypothetical protein
MKKTFAMMLACAWLCAGCVVGFRSNLTYNVHKNRATTEGTIEDSSQYSDAAAVNADKSYSDLLNGSGNNNGVNKGEAKGEEEKEEAQPEAK